MIILSNQGPDFCSKDSAVNLLNYIFWIPVHHISRGVYFHYIGEKADIFVNQKTYFLLNTGDNKLFFSVLLREHTDVLIYKSNLLLLLYSLSIGAAGRRIQSRSERELTASLCGKSATFFKHDSVCEPQTSSSLTITTVSLRTAPFFFAITTFFYPVFQTVFDIPAKL